MELFTRERLYLMNKKISKELLELTQECLMRYWQHDYEYVLGFCSKNVTWIGSTEEQFMRGIDAVRADFAAVDREIKSCHLNHQEFFIAHIDTKSCSVCGRYLVTTDAGEDSFLQVQQRCQFVWMMENGEPKIQSIYVSNPMGELYLNDGEQFPNWLGKRTLQYVKESIALAKEQKRFAITDVMGVTHFLCENEVEHIKADGHNVILYIKGKETKFYLRFSDYMEKHGNSLVQVHRCYAVNPMYVVQMENNKITMQSGTVIAIPVKRIAALRERIKMKFEN